MKFTKSIREQKSNLQRKHFLDCFQQARWKFENL